MACADWAERISAYIDEELTPADRGEVEKHLASCADCARAAGGLRKMSGLVRSLPRVGAPAGLREAVRAAIAPASQPKEIPFFARHRAWLQTAAALVATLLLVYGFYSPSSSVPQGASSARLPQVTTAERPHAQRAAEMDKSVAMETPPSNNYAAAAGEAGGSEPALKAPAVPQPNAQDLKAMREERKSDQDDSAKLAKAPAQPAAGAMAPAPPAAPGATPADGIAEEAKEREKRKTVDALARRCEVEMLCADPGDAERKVARLLRDLRVNYEVKGDHQTQVVVRVPADRTDEVVEALNKLDPSRCNWRVAQAQDRGVAGKKSGRGLDLAEKQEAQDGPGSKAGGAPAESRAANADDARRDEARRGRLPADLLDEEEALQKQNGAGIEKDHATAATLTLIISLEPQAPAKPK